MQQNDFHIVLISTYEMGRQPFGLASPVAWLRQSGFRVTAVDCAVMPFPESAVREARMVAFYLPMHTATRLAAGMIRRVRQVNPAAHICCYGLYAPLNAAFLNELGVDSIIGGEFEARLLAVSSRLSGGSPTGVNGQPFQEDVGLEKLTFLVPDRTGLPGLQRYARLCCGREVQKVTGYTEATRGCKHRCRHCPVVPVYNGNFRVVQREVVLADIRRQVELGAAHITFGDPDFFNGPGHAAAIVQALHAEFPHLSYDVTIKIEHLLKHRELLPLLRDTGCAFVTSAVEAVDDQILQYFAKGHTRADFIAVAALFRETGLLLNPTFVAFNPWISLAGYRDLLRLLAELGLVEQVSPIQLAIRLLIPNGSLLLNLPGIQPLLGEFNRELLTYQWQHPDPRVDELQRTALQLVERGSKSGASRREIFAQVWAALNAIANENAPLPVDLDAPQRAEIPYLNEPWYC